MHVLYSFDFGGLETCVANLINHTASDRFSHSLCVFSSKLSALEKIKNKALKTFVIKRNFKHDLSLFFRLAQLLRKEKPDILATYNWGAIEGILAAKGNGVRGVIHSEHGFDMEEVFERKRRRVLARRILTRFCDNVVTVSKALQKWLIENVQVDENKVQYIPNACDPEHFYPGKNPEKRKALGINESDFVIGTVGALKELKDQATLLKAFARVVRFNPHVRLILIGEGSEQEHLENLSEDLGVKDKMLIISNVSDPAPFYRVLDLFVLPSLAENFPMALLEAMSSGLPIIATDVGDIPYMLDGNKGGVIIKPGDINALFDGIKLFLKNPEVAREKGSYVRTRAEDLFSIDQMVNRYESLYTSVANGKIVD